MRLLKLSSRFSAVVPTVLLLCPAWSGEAKTTVTVTHNKGEQWIPAKGVPLPRRNDAGAAATFSVIDGSAFGSDRTKPLNDGLLPLMEDDPDGNFFFVGGDRKRLLIDLGKLVPVSEFNSFSWHPGSRGPQVYKLYASAGTAPKFDARPKAPLDPVTCGWQLVAAVDTRRDARAPGGQYAVSVTDPSGSIGEFRYFLLDVSSTDPADPESDTFFSEIDVVDRNAPAKDPAAEDPGVDAYDTADGRARFFILYNEAPDLKDWTRTKLAPVVAKWYPMICGLLKSPGSPPPRRFTIKFPADRDGVAVTMGTHVEGSPPWYRENLDTEALGSLVHELVHVVQQYQDPPKGGPGQPVPTWLSEGIADYVRWQVYEPKPRFRVSAANVSQIHYDDSYQTSADFLAWATKKYNKQLVPALNAAGHQGLYNDSLWRTLTGFSAPELGNQWRAEYAKKLGVKLPPPPDAEAKPRGR